MVGAEVKEGKGRGKKARITSFKKGGTPPRPHFRAFIYKHEKKMRVRSKCT